MADVNVPTIYEEVAVAEDVTAEPIFPISVYEAVTLTESASWGLEEFWQFGWYTPAWELSAEFGLALQGESYIPVWAGVGKSGSRLDKDIPARSFSGTMDVDSIGFTVNSNLPTWSMAGQTGFQMSKISPTWEITSSFDMTYVFSLDKRIPLLKITSSMFETGAFQLDQSLPVRKLSASMDVSADDLTLDAKIPGALILTASMYEQATFQLDAVIAARTIAGAMWSDTWELDEKIPVWMINAVMLDTKPAVHPDSSITSDSFDGVLRYIRP